MFVRTRPRLLAAALTLLGAAGTGTQNSLAAPPFSAGASHPRSPADGEPHFFIIDRRDERKSAPPTQCTNWTRLRLPVKPATIASPMQMAVSPPTPFAPTELELVSLPARRDQAAPSTPLHPAGIALAPTAVLPLAQPPALPMAQPPVMSSQPKPKIINLIKDAPPAAKVAELTQSPIEKAAPPAAAVAKTETPLANLPPSANGEVPSKPLQPAGIALAPTAAVPLNRPHFAPNHFRLFSLRKEESPAPNPEPPAAAPAETIVSPRVITTKTETAPAKVPPLPQAPASPSEIRVASIPRREPPPVEAAPAAESQAIALEPPTVSATKPETPLVNLPPRSNAGAPFASLQPADVALAPMAVIAPPWPPAPPSENRFTRLPTPEPPPLLPPEAAQTPTNTVAAPSMPAIQREMPLANLPRGNAESPSAPLQPAGIALAQVAVMPPAPQPQAPPTEFRLASLPKQERQPQTSVEPTESVAVQPVSFSSGEFAFAELPHRFPGPSINLQSAEVKPAESRPFVAGQMHLVSLPQRFPAPAMPLSPIEVSPVQSTYSAVLTSEMQLTSLRQPAGEPPTPLQPTEVLPIPAPSSPTAPRVPSLDQDRPIAALTTNIEPPTGQLPADMAREKFDSEYPAYLPRPWGDVTYFWDAPDLCFNPLRYEEVNLERYGYSHCPAVQPALSAAHFFCATLALPYTMTARHCGECIYPLGHYRPGSPVPFRHIHPEPNPFAATAEVGTIAGLILLIP